MDRSLRTLERAGDRYATMVANIRAGKIRLSANIRDMMCALGNEEVVRYLGGDSKSNLIKDMPDRYVLAFYRNIHGGITSNMKHEPKWKYTLDIFVYDVIFQKGGARAYKLIVGNTNNLPCRSSAYFSSACMELGYKRVKELLEREFLLMT